MKDIELKTMEGLARVFLRMMYEKNRALYLHSLRTAKIAQGICSRLSAGEEAVDLTVIAAKLHDVGKLLMPDEILSKQGRYREKERKFMEYHPVVGAEIISQYFSAELSLEAEKVILSVRHHHERYDGSGYPSGFKDGNNPIMAQIIGLADYYAALTEKRPYRPPFSEKEIKRFLVKSRGLFHPVVMDALMESMESGMEDLSINESKGLRDKEYG